MRLATVAKRVGSAFRLETVKQHVTTHATSSLILRARGNEVEAGPALPAGP